MRRALLLSVLIAALLPRITSAQPSPQFLTGRVLGDSGKPLVDAIVIVTMAPDRQVARDTSREDGRWRIGFQGASGDYLVYIAAEGFTAVRKRVTASVADSIVIVNVTLARVAQRLSAVNVVATRTKPDRITDYFLPDGVSTEAIPAGVTGALTADVAGDLSELAATIPGLSMVPGGGISAFGLDASQSSTTLNGLAFPGASLPRNARTTTRFTSSTYDPSRGGFAGVETAVALSVGTNNTRRSGNVTLDAPMLQATDQATRRLGHGVTGGQASIGGSGALVEDKWYYNASADLSRRVVDAPSLIAPDASLFSMVAVAPDSVRRLLDALAVLRIPATVAASQTSRVVNKAAFAIRLDHKPYLPQSLTDSPRTWGIVALGNVTRSAAQGFGLTATPSRGAELANSYGVLQAIYSSYVGDYSLSEVRSSVFAGHSRGAPYLLLPAGTVLVSSVLPDGSSGTSSLSFGGNAGYDNADTQWGWDSRADYQWAVKPFHRARVTLGSRFEGYRSHTPGDALGSFSYASLADLAANHPSSFSRTLGDAERTGGAWSGFASLGDQWKASPTLQIMYGGRIETNRYLTTPMRNVELERALGVRNDLAPSHVHISPRLGFAWRYGANALGNGAGYSGIAYSSLGARVIPPTGLIRGGIGEFRSSLSPQLLSTPEAFTGLTGAARRIACLGEAVPAPDWSGYLGDAARIPATCAGSSSAYFSDAAPQVRLVDPSFDAPRSWRATLGILTVVRKVSVSVDAAAALNLNQGSSYDVNFAGAPKFTLAEEGRQVFASAAGIDPATGLFSAVDSRRSPTFGSVLSRRSDLSSVTKQMTITMSPMLNTSSLILNVSYTLGSTRGDVRGFEGAAFGDPRTVSPARTDLDVRHRIQVQAGKSLPAGFNFTMFLVAHSGLPYTPIVSGDVNGDGVSGDRAFVFDPAQLGDATLAAGMRSLLASAPSNARNCLVSQLGQPSRRNSCEGPWIASTTARIAVANSTGPFGRRVNAALSITNPLGGVDRLLHGDAVHGWGTTVSPDPTLLVVRGFDPVGNRFRYDVNSRFGSTSLSQTTVRLPFRVTIDVNFDLAPPAAQQQLQRALNRGRGGRPGLRLSVDSIRSRFKRNVPSVYAMVLQEADSLLLSREQMDSLRAANERWSRASDVIWKQLGGELAAMNDDYDVQLATRMTEDATDAAWEMARREIPTLKRILSPLQFTLAPGLVQYLGTVKGRILFRYYAY